MEKLFGTDGIRGVALDELTEELVYKLGVSLATIINKTKNNSTVTIAKDTRISSNIFEKILIDTLTNNGINIIKLGIIPTPATSYLTNLYKADYGIMITASHNPWQYNGIKIFNSNGYKIPDELELELEDLINNFKENNNKEKKGTILNKYNPINDYVNHLINSLNSNLEGLNIAIDVANGATSNTAELLFKKLKCNAIILNNNYNGHNINENCGSTHIEYIKKYVIENKLDAGIAYDGDGDRCIIVDNKGNILDGDTLLAIFSKYLQINTIVGTIMSNLGLIKYCKKNNINFVSTKVGDRYVLERMLEDNYILGGEQSGHIILRDYMNTGDGELSSIKLLEIVKTNKLSLNSLSNIFNKYPQITENININNNKKYKLTNLINNNEEINKLKKKISNDYRILIRASGTEALIRVTIEGKDIEIINKIKKEILNIIKKIIDQ